MKKISLNGIWQMRGAGYECEGAVPGSVYSFLLDKGLMEDPFYGLNELEALKLLDNEFAFTKTFDWRYGDATLRRPGYPVRHLCEWGASVNSCDSTLNSYLE